MNITIDDVYMKVSGKREIAYVAHAEGIDSCMTEGAFFYDAKVWCAEEVASVIGRVDGELCLVGLLNGEVCEISINPKRIEDCPAMWERVRERRNSSNDRLDILDVESSLNAAEGHAENIGILANDLINDYNLDADDFTERDVQAVRAFIRTIYRKLIMICDYAYLIKDEAAGAADQIGSRPFCGTDNKNNTIA